MQTEAMKYSIELFDGKNDFALWQSTVKDVLTCQGLDAALEETKPAEMKDSDWTLSGKIQWTWRWRKSRSKSRPKKDYGEVQCFYCGELGHKQYKYPKFKEDFSNMKILMKSQETKGKGKANIVEENMVEVLACEECDPELGKRTMATGEKVNIEGIGDVCLNVHNGRAKILKNVRYVPKCSSNIIALSELTTRECKYVGKQEWCKVYKGGRLVLRGRKNKHNIYVLEQHPERRLNKTMRKMVWKPKGMLVNGKEINMTKKKVSFNNEVVFGDGSRRCDFPSDHILVQN
ncbi:hypothetical protein SLEP1_g51094 [Rubroshorea leprosula]|uniref:Retrovirus-related Pol polyprotein from transposon TNT 1-94-like beta-barrel domain-containing protein n=1 Tax=Rubroshorea leprosula TaxID=152421 RepID=A0AAV5M2B6_9ROSI|nr:hypothetical protein SLEP1_g51094 [Rubroshorea leprosula]